MAKYVPDISSHRWVILAEDRVKRPDDQEKKQKKHVCAFCKGNEALTPPEVFRIGPGKPNEPGWQVRVIPNLYPITDIHEVIVHSPDHKKDIENMQEEQVAALFKAYRERYLFYQEKGQVLIFCNHGEHAGASLTHPHSQLVVLPHQINLETLLREPLQNVVWNTVDFNVYCPDFSQWPYEVWIAPKVAETFFGDTTDGEIAQLATIVKKVTKRLEHIYETKELFAKVNKDTHPFGYNYYIYPKKSWYMRIIPRLVHRAGFELGTGLSVNIIDPAIAAKDLQDERR